MPTLSQRVRNGPGFLAGLALIFAAAPLQASEKNPVIVHEWGTFTSLQDGSGKTIDGINVDDEPVPFFVYTDGQRPVVAQHDADFGLPPYLEGKGIAAGDPAVTMRLETPVIYIYPPKGEPPRSVPPLQVHVDFHGGILSQFFPYAKLDGLLRFEGTNMHHGALTEATTTSLTWSGIKLGSKRVVVSIDSPVWTTPRETSAPILEVNPAPARGENPLTDNFTAEHFLFYRGVGHLDSPIQLRYSQDEVRMEHRLNSGKSALGSFDHGWIVEIRPDGTCAFHPVDSPGTTAVGGMIEPLSPQISIAFKESDFSKDNLAKLQASMQATLVKQGLYPDEASAMLRTWDVSYFKSPGLRFFYTVPRTWTDAVLPLRVSGAPSTITRVMIGRIELISEAQKAAIKRLAAGPPPDLAAVKMAARLALHLGNYSTSVANAYYRGDLPLRNLGIPIPPLTQDYLNLGRFRDVLLVHEQQVRPTPALAHFIQDNQIGSQPSRDDTTPVGTTASN